ncbi:MAG: Lrp/AsnC ligand binding domain-containing protein [Candidatus Bathyarchaeia archaeon]
MPSAYVLLNTEIGAEAEVLEALKKVDGIQEVFNLWGVYDIIARIKVDTMERLSRIVNEKLNIGKVHSKLTVVVTET